VVNVAGWVRRPGVYQFHQGQRVIDALKAAGGPKKNAALDALNLAALLTDAEQILVPKIGAAGVTAPGAVAPGTSSPGSTSAGAAGAKVNINTAPESDLEALPGIGPVLAQRIIDYRTQHGPFQSVNELLNVSGIGDKRLADMKSQVSV